MQKHSPLTIVKGFSGHYRLQQLREHLTNGARYTKWQWVMQNTDWQDVGITNVPVPPHRKKKGGTFSRKWKGTSTWWQLRHFSHFTQFQRKKTLKQQENIKCITEMSEHQTGINMLNDSKHMHKAVNTSCLFSDINYSQMTNTRKSYTKYCLPALFLFGSVFRFLFFIRILPFRSAGLGRGLPLSNWTIQNVKKKVDFLMHLMRILHTQVTIMTITTWHWCDEFLSVSGFLLFIDYEIIMNCVIIQMQTCSAMFPPSTSQTSKRNWSSFLCFSLKVDEWNQSAEDGM